MLDRRAEGGDGRDEPPIRGKSKIKHGLYSKDVRAGLMDAIERARSDPRLDHSSEYLARSKAMLDALLQRIADQQVPLDTDVVEAVSRIVNRISSMLLRKKQIEDGIKVRLYTEAREQLVQRLAGVLHKHKGARIDDKLIRTMAEELLA